MEAWRQKLYSNYSTTKGRNFENIRINCKFFNNVIKPLLPGNKDSKIIDLAAGHGSMLHCLKQAGYKNIQGIDISKEEVDIAHKLGINEMEQCDLFEFLKTKDEKYDVILLIDILEHLSREELFTVLSSVKKILNTDGKIIIQVPNAAGLFGMRIRYGDLTHEIAYTYNSLLQACTANGLKNFNAYEIPPVKSGIKGRIRNILWQVLVLPIRIIFYLETGQKKHYLSQNIIVSATV